MPLTLPAHSSIFTGLLPFHNGVRDNGDFYLDAQKPTLATMLKAAGFSTAGFVSAFVLDSRWGIANGFDRYYDDFTVSAGDIAAMARVQRRGGDTWSEARRWLDAHVQDKFFLWLHLFDPHTPYDPPEPFRSLYGDRPYDAEIAYSDSIVGQVLDYLGEKQVLDRTLIVFLSDHGEGLGDHGEDEHGLLAYDSTLHVPLIVRLPARAAAGRVIDQPVSLVDVVPTVLGLLGLPVPGGLDGVNLAPHITGHRAAPRDELYAETYYPRLRFDWSELVSVRNDRYKLIRAPRPELYEYRVDPGESHNPADANTALVSRLNQILDRIAPDARAPVATAVDPDAVRRLESLGYIGGAATIARTSPTRADPKDKTAIYRRLAHAREALARGSEREGVSLLEAIVLEDTDLGPARQLIREYWTSRGEAKRGAAWFRAAAERHPDRASLWMELGSLNRAAGTAEEAARSYQRALAVEPDRVDALTGLAEVLRDAKRYDEALALFRKAAAQSSDPSPHIRVAETLIKMGRLTEADGVLTSTVASEPHTTGVHYLIAQIAEQQHNPARAELEYRREMAVSPWDYRAPFNLAALVGARNDHREQVALLESIPTIAPQFGELYFYLAKALLDLGDQRRLNDAVAAAARGLQLAPASQSAPLGHYVLADIYNLERRPAEAKHEMELGRALEQQLSSAAKRTP